MKQPLVLRKFDMPLQSANGLYLNIEGRRGGIISFLLTVLNLNPVTSFKCYHNRIEFKRTSLSGEQLIIIPLTAVTAVQSGFTKPIGFLFAGIVFTILSIIAMYVNVNSDFYEYQSAAGGVAVGMFVLAILFWIFYFLKKDMNLSIQNGGDLDYGLVFKRSVIENVPVDIKKVKQASLLVNAAVLQAATMEKV